MLKNKKSIRKEWVKRLRSRKYKKGIGALQKDGKFCCLGVLCELAVENKIISKPAKSIYDDSTVYEGETGLLPVAVKDWVGLRKNGGDYNGTKYQSLVDLNDDSGAPFHKIARLIESEPKGLFED